MTAQAVNLKIIQGSTFSKVFRWAQPTKAYKQISAITKAGSPVITANSHGVPNGWPVKVNNVEGMTQINSDEYRKATVLTGNTLELNEVNAAGFDSYSGGGIVEYSVPVDLTGFTARLQMRQSIGNTTVLKELTTENGGIAIDTTACTITLAIPATETDDLDFQTAVYSLELVSSGGVVSQIAKGDVSVEQEVTR